MIAGITVFAQTNAIETRALSLEDCLQIAIEHNLDVQIKRYNPQIAQFALDSAYGAYDPNLFVSGGHDFNSSPSGIDPQGRPFPSTETDINRFSTRFDGALPYSGFSYSFGGNIADSFGTAPENAQGRIGIFQMRQPLLKNFWIDNIRLQILLDKKNLKISELDVRSQVMTTVTDVETAYYNLIFSQESVKVQSKALELANQLVRENKKRVEVGALAPLDERQAEAQAAASRADLLAALGTEDTQQRVLKSLLSDNYSKWKDVSIQPTVAMLAVPGSFNLQDSWERGLRSRPDLLQQGLTLEKQGFQVKYTHNQLFPQLDLVGDYGYTASASDFTGALGQYRSRESPFWSVGAELSIPLGNRNARGNYRAAKASKEQITLQFRQLQQNILIQIENAIATAKTSFQRVDATREARVYAEAALDAEQKKLESGKSTSFEVLRLQRDLTSARSAEIRALADYNIALAQIALNEGSTLDRRNVSVDFK